MNKKYKYITEELIEIINEKGEKIERKIENGNPTKVLELENKIEIISNMENDINKKMKFRKEFSKFSPLWIKVHMSIPILTLMFLITSCLTGWIYINTIFEIIYYCSLYSFAIFNTCIIVGILKIIADKSINGLSSKLEELKHMKKELENKLLNELIIKPGLTNNKFELNNTVILNETLTKAEETVLSSAYSNGFRQKTKKLVRKKNINQ